MKNMYRRFLIVSLALLGGSSCIRNRDYIYLQSPAEKAYWDTSPLKAHKLRKAQEKMRIQDSSVFVPNEVPEEYIVQSGDILKIDIRGFDEKVNQLFNLFLAQNMNVGGLAASGGDPYFMFGYVVTDSGTVDLPVMGRIRLGGLTMTQAQAAVQGELDRYFEKAYVRVALGGIRFSVLGQVRNPGKFTVMQNRLTILEAVAQAGEIMPDADRRRVKLIRQYPSGSQIVTLDLTDRRLLESSYYFIRPNDMLIINPLRVRELGTGLTAQQSMGAVLTAISLLVNSILLYNTLRNL